MIPVMNCPKCKNKKGHAIQADPITRKCPKCNASLYVDRSGKMIVRGVSVKPSTAAAGSGSSPKNP